MLTEETVPPFLVSENTAVPAELDVRFTVSAVVEGLPLASSSWTVIGPELAVSMTPLQETADDMKTSLLVPHPR